MMKNYKDRRIPLEMRDMPVERVLIGGLHVSSTPIVLDTVLGSCIAACLYDEKNRIGGMNHFMLPEAAITDKPTNARYGVYAMELLISDMMKAGSNKEDMTAKVFGGGHVLNIKESLSGVPQRNIDFIHRFLEQERIPLISEDVGGYHPRRILFNTSTGKVMLRKLDTVVAQEKAKEEEKYLDTLKKEKLDGDVELF